MNEHLHHNEPVLSKDFGWSSMQVLLDEHMRTQLTLKQPPRRWQILSAAILVGILMCAGLQIGDSFLAGNFDKHVLRSATSHANVLSTDTNTITRTLPRTGTMPIRITRHTEERQVPVSEEENLRAALKDQQTEPSKAPFLPGKIAGMKAEAATIPFHATLHGLTVTNALPGKRRGQQWDLAVGLGQHVSLHGSNQLAPFPAAEISYQVSKQFALRVGLDIFAPVQSNAKTLNKTVYVNDPLNNIQLINETITYQRLSYINIPVSLSLAVSKNLFVETGVQASFLVSHKKSTGIEAYDYQMNRLPAPSNGPPLIAAASPPPQVPATPANMDYRLLGGVRYTMGKTSFLVNYQQGLNPVLAGRTSADNRNQLLTLKVLYRLK